MEQKESQSPGEVTCPRGCTVGVVAEQGPQPNVVLLWLYPGYPSRFSLPAAITCAELESQGDDINAAGVFPGYPDASVGRDLCFMPFFEA